MTTTVLISGGGIAGPTLAYWLARRGFRPTIVERSAGLRSSGNPVDVRGEAMPVAAAMGVVPELRAAATRASAMSLIDASGRRVARVRMRNAGGRGTEVEVPRADLPRSSTGRRPTAPRCCSTTPSPRCGRTNMVST